MLLVELRNTALIGTPSQEASCPHDCLATGICEASLSSMTISSELRQIYCANDNYDNCPVFLARVLRRR